MSKRGLLGVVAVLGGCAVLVVGCAAGSGSATSAQTSPRAATAITRQPLATATTSPGSPQPSLTSQEPRASVVVITGQVKDVEPNTRIIHLDGQVHGFTTVTLDSDVQIVSVDGSPRTLQDIKPGNLIQSAGQAVGSDAVLATKIRILPAQAPSAAG